MLFNSLQFLIFFPVVFFVYFALPARWRNPLLLGASIYFYMSWKPEYILLVLLSVIVDYSAGRLMVHKSFFSRRKLLLATSIVVNLLILFTFKYYNFFTDSLSGALGFFGTGAELPFSSLILPLGISFYTFQSMGYTIDVYRGKVEPEKNFFIFFLYVMFFPQLVAGPIERASNLLPAFREKHSFDYRNATDGLKLIAWGIFKKIVIADRLAVFVDQIYASPTDFTGMPLIIGTVFFAFQIYCDFSGYSDIAIGSAQMLGFRLMDNFRRPYHATSIADFWSRWHISLSTWFRDYLYIPLGGSRTHATRHWFNLFATFLISGLWHGAQWTFVIWGALNGLYLLISIWTKPSRIRAAKILRLDLIPHVHKAFQIFFTFTLTLIAWVFFRARTLGDALYIMTHAFDGLADWWLLKLRWVLDFLKGTAGASYEYREFMIAVAVILFMECVHLLQRHSGIRHMLTERHWIIRWLAYLAIIMMILVLGRFGAREFIYFVF